MQMRLYTLLLALGTAAALTGCATLGSLGISVQPPQLAVAEGYDSEIRFVGPGSQSPYGGAVVRLWARVENPNPIGLTLSALDGDFFLEGTRAATVAFPLGLPLTAQQDTVIPLDIRIDFSDLPALADLAVQALTTREPLDYRLDGTLAVDAGPLGTPSFGPSTWLTGALDVER